MRGLLKYLGYMVAGVTIGGALASGACSEASSNSDNVGGFGGSAADGGGNAGAGGSGAIDASSGGSGGTILVDGNPGDVPISPDAACDLQKYQATLKKKPVDIIFIVDNSCSMSEEAQAIEDNINVNFAQIIQNSGIDFRVILIAEHGDYGSGQSICIDPPLSGAPCPSPVGTNTPPINNPPIFYHYDNDDVESNDGWCKAYVWANQPDRYQQMPNGWLSMLRADASKSFVMVTDDRVRCLNAPSWYCSTGACDYDDTTNSLAAAQAFDADLLALSPTQFGSPAQRNYVWHSIVGVPEKGGQPYLPTDPLVPSTSKCGSAVNSSEGNQQLSILTGGLRFPVCDGTGFSTVFQEIAKGVIEGAKIECEFPMPEAPPGKELDPNTLSIEFTPSTGGNTQKFVKVDSLAQCKPGAFYVEGDTIKLCPDTCTTVQADAKAKIQILALCKPDVPV
jgi:hypothetical protein